MRRTTSNGNKHHYSAWDEALVWVCLDPPKGLWQQAQVVTYEIANVTNKEWKFKVKLIESGSIHEVVSVSIDNFCLEFLSVKRRDKDPAKSKYISDMTSLSFLNEPEMVECMRQRFHDRSIYTNIGPILVAINPFERLSIYTDTILDNYYLADLSEAKRLGPHVYQIGYRAYNKMFVDKFDPSKRENQSMLISGESGAGKTESTKHILHFLGAVSTKVASKLNQDSSANNFESLITAANPITESFGNAKTSRNNNSSRFGKFIELSFSPDGFITQATIRTYLLETVRVTTQMVGERNYHIFYEIFAGLPMEERQSLGIQDLKKFYYINQSGEYNRHDGESDIKNFENLRDAMSKVDLQNNEQLEIFRIIAAVLHIGNVNFDESQVAGDETAVFSKESSDSVAYICKFLGVSDATLLNAVTKRSFVVAGNSIQKSLNRDSALSARDTFAKCVYDMTFKFMINCINNSLEMPELMNDTVSFIGVLDIFGFEHFSKNSFEQICINYANEKLQDHFNFAIFKSEKEVYEEEGIAWTFKDYPDNSERLELFEHKSLGIFALCDENLKIPKPSDEKLVKALYAKCSSHSFFGANKSDQVKSEFVVKHFACDVKYQITGFLEKNKNEIAQEVQELFDSSNVQVVKSFALDESSLGKNSATSGKHVKNRPGMSVGKKTTSLSAQFSKQLSDLISRIRTTRSWFVRCIKSNNQLQSKVFDTDIVIQQLRCGGALGAVQVFRAGFPNRMDFAYFVTRYITFIIVCGMNPLTRDLYQCITKARITGSEKLWRIGASKLIDVVSLTSTMLNIIENVSFPEDVEVLSGLQMGKTQVFLRAPVFEFLERLHTRSVTLIARRMQRRRKATMLTKKGISKASYSAIQSIMYFSDFKRRKAMKVVASTIFLQRIIRVYLAVCLRRRVVRGATILKAHFRGYKARSYVRNLKRLAATKIQSNYRCYSLRKRFCSYKKAVLLLQNNVRVWKAIKLKEHMVECILLMQKVWRGTRVRILLWKYRIKKKLDMEEARKKDAEVKAQFQELLERQIAMNPSFLDDIQDASMKITQLNDRVMHLTLENNALTQENQLLHSRINELLKQLNSAAEPVLSMNTQGELNDPINRLKQEIDLNLKNSCFDNAGYCIGLMETNHHLLVTGLTSGAEKIVSEVDGEGQVGAKCNSLQVRYPPVEVTIKSLRSESSILLGQTTAFEGEQSFNIEHQQLEVGKVEAATVDLMQNELKSLQESYCHHQQLQHLKLEESDSLNPSIDKLIKSLVVAEEALTKHQVSIEIINDTKDGLEIGLQQKEFELRSKMKELYDSKIQIAALNIIVTDLNSKNKELRGYLDKEITNWNQEFTTVKLAVNFCMEKNSLLVESLHSMEISRKALEDLNEARLELIQNLEIENRKLLSDISLLKRSSISTLEGYDHGLNKSYSISTNNLQLQAEVISWMRIDDGDVMYTISVGVNGVEWNTLKSYEHFRTLRSIIGNDLDPELDMEFPPIVFSLFNLNDNEAETRRYMLHRYLTGLISSKKLMGRNNVYQAVLDFLGADTGEA